MAKEAYYFSHDSNARNDIKIKSMKKRYGIAGYGRFWILIEMLRDEESHKLPLKAFTFIALAEEFGCDEEEAKKYISDLIEVFELLHSDNEFFWSESLLRRMDLREQARQQRIDAGKKSAAKRAAKKQQNLTDSQRSFNGRSTNAQQGKERKGKEIEGKEKKVKESEGKEMSVRENVQLTHTQFEKLGKEFDVEELDWMFDKLSAYKQQKGVSYESDYGAIRAWVIEALNERKQKKEKVPPKRKNGGGRASPNRSVAAVDFSKDYDDNGVPIGVKLGKYGQVIESST